MGQIMVRLIRAGSTFVGLEQKKEGSKGKGSLGRWGGGGEGGSAYSTSSTLTVCWLHLDRSVHL